jgi:hypothetical protein
VTVNLTLFEIVHELARSVQAASSSAMVASRLILPSAANMYLTRSISTAERSTFCRCRVSGCVGGSVWSWPAGENGCEPNAGQPSATWMVNPSVVGCDELGRRHFYLHPLVPSCRPYLLAAR